MARLALALGAALVIGLVAMLVVQVQPDDSAPPAAPAAAASPGARPAGGDLTSAGVPRRMSAAAAPSMNDASPLPTPAEVKEARARVEAEHERSPNRAPHILDNNLKAKPMRDARKAFSRGDYPAALERAQDALAVEPDAASSRVLAVMAACGMGERAVAQAHADKLDDMRKARVAKRCAKFGIEIQGVKPGADEE